MQSPINIRRESSPRSCPSCGAARVAPIVCSEPKPVVARAATLELLLTWGRVVHSDLPRWAYLTCGHRWDRLDDGGAEAWHGVIGWAIRGARLT